MIAEEEVVVGHEGVVVVVVIEIVNEEVGMVDEVLEVELAVLGVAFPSEGVAEHVDTRSPVAKFLRPSADSASLGPSGTVPTTDKLVECSSRVILRVPYALKL